MKFVKQIYATIYSASSQHCINPIMTRLLVYIKGSVLFLNEINVSCFHSWLLADDKLIFQKFNKTQQCKAQENASDKIPTFYIHFTAELLYARLFVSLPPPQSLQSYRLWSESTPDVAASSQTQNDRCKYEKRILKTHCSGMPKMEKISWCSVTS